MKIKKIALVENSGIDFYNSRLRFALYLKNLNYEVSVIIPNDGYVNKIRNEGITVIDVGSNIRGLGILNKLKFAYHLIKIFTHEKFNIIHTYRLQPNIIGTFFCWYFYKI